MRVVFLSSADAEVVAGTSPQRNLGKDPHHTDHHTAAAWYDSEANQRYGNARKLIAPSWDTSSWRLKPAKQIPQYHDAQQLRECERQLRQLPAIVTAGEVMQLRQKLAKVCRREGFVLQAGDCAESFRDLSSNYVRDTLCVMLQASVILAHASGVPVIPLARMAGQYAKPRSSDQEVVQGETLPVYRGDIINSISPTLAARTADPQRMLQGYTHAVATSNILRAYISGGLANLKRIHQWNLNFIRHSPVGERFQQLSREIARSLRFMAAYGLLQHNEEHSGDTMVYSSHEALLLPFEEALTRQDHFTGHWIDTSAHFLWIGDRTRQHDHAHVEFLRGVVNPIGIKCGPTMNPNELKQLLSILNPHNDPGRISLITRMGKEKAVDALPPLLQAVREEGAQVVWLCDPMHGNTIKSRTGYKTRNVADITQEIEEVVSVHKAEGSYLGGLHLEMTGQNVTECSGGGQKITDDDLSQRYHTACDPRLNAHQTLEIAFQVADWMRQDDA